MKRSAVLVLLYSHLAYAAAQNPPTPGVKATLSMASETALELQYDVPDGCTKLAFTNNGIGAASASAMRSGWKALEQCEQLDADAIKITGSCTHLRFQVPTDARDLDRVYPWAFPFKGGIYSYTSAFAVQSSCGAVRWQFNAPAGGAWFWTARPAVWQMETRSADAHVDYASGGALCPENHDGDRLQWPDQYLYRTCERPDRHSGPTRPCAWSALPHPVNLVGIFSLFPEFTIWRRHSDWRAALNSNDLPAAPDRIRVLVVDDHPMLRAGLLDTIVDQLDMRVIGEAANGEEAVHQF